MTSQTSFAPSDEHEVVRVLFPLHQVALITAVILMLAMQPVQPVGAELMYFVLALSWLGRVAWTLGRQDWRTMRLCSTHTAIALLSALWHSVLGIYVGVVWASWAALATLALLGLYGVLCRDR